MLNNEEYIKKLEEENKLLIKRNAELEIRKGIVDFLTLSKGELYRSFSFDTKLDKRWVLTGSLKYLLEMDDSNLSSEIYACVSDESTVFQGKDVKRCFEMPQKNFKKQIFNDVHKGPTNGSY